VEVVPLSCLGAGGTPKRVSNLLALGCEKKVGRSPEKSSGHRKQSGGGETACPLFRPSSLRYLKAPLVWGPLYLNFEINILTNSKVCVGFYFLPGHFIFFVEKGGNGYHYCIVGTVFFWRNEKIYFKYFTKIFKSLS